MDGSNAETAVWFPDVKAVPDEATFSRAFAEFAKARLAEHVHEALVKSYLGEALIGHISRDGTAIEARERPGGKAPGATAPALCKKRDGREAKNKAVPAKVNRIAAQRMQCLAEMLRELPRGDFCKRLKQVIRNFKKFG